MLLSDFKAEWLHSKPYIEAHTSGSTGAPKQIKLLKADMRASARATNERFHIRSSSVLGIPLDFDYIAAKMMAVRAWEADCRLEVLSVSNQLVIPTPLSLLSVVPSQVDSLLKQPELATRIDNIIIGGGPLAPSKEKQLIEAGFTAHCSYGMTETCSHVALRSIGQDYYTAMPGISFSLDSRNCLVITAPAFSFGTLVTNDMVELLDSTSFRWLGRADNVIISGGIKMHPEQIEAVYTPYIQQPFYIKGIPDDKWGQALCLVVEATEPDDTILPKLKQHIEHKFLPKKMVFISEIPKAQNGKIRRL